MRPVSTPRNVACANLTGQFYRRCLPGETFAIIRRPLSVKPESKYIASVRCCSTEKEI